MFDDTLSHPPAAPLPNPRYGQAASVLFAILLIVASVWFVWFTIYDSRAHNFNDDGFITLTFARGFAESGLMRFHPTLPPTLGTTSPLYTMLLGALLRFLPGVRGEALLIALSAGFRVGCAWLWFVKGRALRLERLERFVIAWLILFNLQIWLEMMTMESVFFVFMLSLAIMIFAERRFVLAGVVGALAFLARGEGLLLLPIFVAWCLGEVLFSRAYRNKGREAIIDCLKIVFGAAPVLVVWAAYTLNTTGVLLPNTLGAKTIQTSIGWSSFGENLPRLFTDIWTTFRFDVSGQIVSGWVLCALFGLVVALFFRQRVLMLGVWGVAFCIGYLLLRVPAYLWYYLPAIFIVTVFAGIGIGALPGLIREIWQRPRTVQRGLQMVTGLLTLITLAGITSQIGADSPGVNASTRAFRNNQPIADYLRLSDWLVQNTPADSRVAYVEIGFIAWFSARPIADMLALTNPEVLPDVARNDFVAVFEKASPDYFIYLDMYPYLTPILSSERFINTYLPVARIDAVTPVRINHSYMIYQRGKPNASLQTANDAVITFTPDDAHHALSGFEQTPDGLRARPGIDPYIWRQPVTFCAADYAFVAVTLAASADITERQFEFYYATDAVPEFNPEMRYVGMLRRDAQTQQYLIPTALLPKWEGTITGLRVDPILDGATPDSHVTIKELRLIRGETQCDK
jgi:hypothetical protein